MKCHLINYACLHAMAGCEKDDDLNKMFQMLDNPTLEEFEQTIFRYETKCFKKQMGGSANGSVKAVEKSRGNGRGRGRNRNKSRNRSQSRSKSSGSGSSDGKNNDKNVKTCYFCKKEGHLKRDCYKWKAAVKSIEYETTSEGDTDMSVWYPMWGHLVWLEFMV